MNGRSYIREKKMQNWEMEIILEQVRVYLHQAIIFFSYIEEK